MILLFYVVTRVTLSLFKFVTRGTPNNARYIRLFWGGGVFVLGYFVGEFVCFGVFSGILRYFGSGVGPG